MNAATIYTEPKLPPKEWSREGAADLRHILGFFYQLAMGVPWAEQFTNIILKELRLVLPEEQKNIVIRLVKSAIDTFPKLALEEVWDSCIDLLFDLIKKITPYLDIIADPAEKSSICIDTQEKLVKSFLKTVEPFIQTKHCGYFLSLSINTVLLLSPKLTNQVRIDSLLQLFLLAPKEKRDYHGITSIFETTIQRIIEGANTEHTDWFSNLFSLLQDPKFQTYLGEMPASETEYFPRLHLRLACQIERQIYFKVSAEIETAQLTPMTQSLTPEQQLQILGIWLYHELQNEITLHANPNTTPDLSHGTTKIYPKQVSGFLNEVMKLPLPSWMGKEDLHTEVLTLLQKLYMERAGLKIMDDEMEAPDPIIIATELYQKIRSITAIIDLEKVVELLDECLIASTLPYSPLPWSDYD